MTQPKSVLRSQVNELIRTIPEGGKMARSEFCFEPKPAITNFQVELPLRLQFKSSPFYFQVNDRYGGFRCSGVPDTRSFGFGTSLWSGVIDQFKEWFQKVKEEVLEPDPWTLLAEAKILGDKVSSSEDTEPFNEQDLLLIQENLSAIREFLIAEAAPSNEQLKLIDEKLSYVIGAAKRQIKMDWANTTVGVMFTLATGLALAPEQANRLFHLTSQLIKTVFVRLLT